MPNQHFTREEEAFLGYVRNMPASVGKRFLLALVDHGGFEAFEGFWERLHGAYVLGKEKPFIGLNDTETYCLAKARYCTSRRHFLTKAAGIGLCGLSFETARRGAGHAFNLLENMSADEMYQRHHTTTEAMDAAIDIGVSVGSGMAGAALLYKKSDLPTRDMVHKIIYSEDFTEVHELMDSLNRMITPIEISLDETRPGFYR